MIADLENELKEVPFMLCLLICRSPERKERRFTMLAMKIWKGIVSPGLGQYLRHPRFVQPIGLLDDN